ncbi:MAG TPA: DUF4397 domain-containing protein [Anaerolineae bacterium]|nr:DUF4397 domain-containing protein [Anaerolineae bacterium]HPL30610.1 DUF4397 domain-containing protein [Anaerolineae bacterium]
MKRWSMIAVALVLALALGLPATLTALSQTPTPTTQPGQANQAMVRAVNAAVNVGPVNVTTGTGTTAFCNLAYKGVTRYIAAAPGAFSFSIVPIGAAGGVGGAATGTPAAGTPSATAPTSAMTPTKAATTTATMTATARATMTATAAMTGTAATQAAPSGGGGGAVVGGAIPGSTTVVAGQAYSLVIVGTPANVQTLTLTDNLSAPPSGQAKVRFVHASPDAPAVDVKVAGGATLFSNIAFKSASDYATVAAGTATLQVTQAGSNNVVLTLPVNLNAGTVYTIYAVGLSSGQPPLQGLVTVESVGGMPVPSNPVN